MKYKYLHARLLLAVLFHLGTSVLFAQAPTEVKIYIMEFEPGSNVGQIEVRKVAAPSTLIGLGFFSKATDLPPHLPYPLIDSVHRNQIVMEHSPEQRNQDFLLTWTKSRTYDDEGRLASYNYSGCEKCIAAPYKYNVHYGKTGKIDRIDDVLDARKSYTIQYDATGQVVSVAYWVGNELIISASRNEPEDIDGGF